LRAHRRAAAPRGSGHSKERTFTRQRPETDSAGIATTLSSTGGDWRASDDEAGCTPAASNFQQLQEI
jgi:hypothetical protein